MADAHSISGVAFVSMDAPQTVGSAHLSAPAIGAIRCCASEPYAGAVLRGPPRSSAALSHSGVVAAGRSGIEVRAGDHFEVADITVARVGARVLDLTWHPS
ncbi:hypothetical protein GCM10022140_33160 [Rhodococcus aetherivorans]